jgi:hypothetical protein
MTSTIPESTVAMLKCAGATVDLGPLLIAADDLEERGLAEEAMAFRGTYDVTRPPFLTGSRAYGTPREDSDTDVVMLLSWSALDSLIAIAEQPDELSAKPRDSDPGQSPDGYRSFSLRFGSLNLIATDSRMVYDCWWYGTQEWPAYHVPLRLPEITQ